MAIDPCPHCNAHINDYTIEYAVADKADVENIRQLDVEEVKIECPKCHKKIKVTIIQCPTYILEKGE